MNVQRLQLRDALSTLEPTSVASSTFENMAFAGKNSGRMLGCLGWGLFWLLLCSFIIAIAPNEIGLLLILVVSVAIFAFIRYRRRNNLAAA